LALDAATEVCSVALLNGSELTERSASSGRTQARELLGMIEALLADSGLTLSELDAVASGVGPGAFTGVRIGVAVAQGLAFGAHLPVVAVTTLEALASRVASAALPALACLDARMGEVYWGRFAVGVPPLALGPLRVSAPGLVELPGEHVGIGRGFTAYPELAGMPGLRLDPEHAQALPRAREIAQVGAMRLEAGGAVSPAQLQPVYVRDKVALTEAERAGR
jgi:tRNA threonylcarbamoyladenosine biosynthesis protein TsaB